MKLGGNRFVVVALGATFCAAAAASALACGSPTKSKSPPPLPGDGQPHAFTTIPVPGCAYAIDIPEPRAFSDVAVDDGAASTAPPLRVRLGLGGTITAGAPGYADPSTSVAFTWETEAASNSARVRLGTSPDALDDVRTGHSWSVAGGRMRFHEAHACGLAPATTYYYRVGSDGAWSATQSFTTLPRGRDASVRVGLSGDARDSVAVFALVQQRMRDAGVAMQLFAGDLVLDGRHEQLFDDHLNAIWKDPSDASHFLTLGQQLIVPVAGNHENQSGAFYASFALPGEGAYAETFGSFDVGAAHVVLLDDESLAVDVELPQSRAMLAWLDADLAQADDDRALHPFVVVMSHRSIMTTGNKATHDDVVAVRGALLPIFDRRHVDLVLQGHDHVYARTTPMRAGWIAERGPVYVTSGGAGASTNKDVPLGGPFLARFAMFGDGTPHIGVYSLLTIASSSITVETYGLKRAGGGVGGDTLVDRFTIVSQ